MRKPLCSKVPLLLYRFGLAGGGVGVTTDSVFLHRWRPVFDTPPTLASGG
jgi:hypothetical protein